MAAATPAATPRRHAGRTGAPRCERETAPAAASPNTLGHRRAERARRRPPRMARRDGRRSRTAGTSATRTATDRPCRSPPMPATSAPTPGQATTAFHPARQRTASGEKATRPPATRWRSCLLHTDGTTRPAPTAAGRRRAGCVRHHGGTPTPNDGGGPPRRAGHGGTGPRYDEPVSRPDGPAPPPHRPPPIARPRARGGPLRDPRRTGADGRGGIGGDATPGPGSARPRGESPAPAHAHSIFCLSR
jgi:hypothetical protein